MADLWYAIIANVKQGPFTHAELKAMADVGKLKLADLVWQEGMADWQAASSVAGLFAETPPIPPVVEPEPVAGDASGVVRPTKPPYTNAWLVPLVVAPVAIQYFLADRSYMLTAAIGLHFALCFGDLLMLDSRRCPGPSFWMAIIAPVYIWRRESIMKVPHYYCAAWGVSFTVAFVMAHFPTHEQYEKFCVPLVNDVLANRLNSQVKCVAVEFAEPLGPNRYRGVAKLNNGLSFEITVETQGRRVYVFIQPQDIPVVLEPP
jgi:hypothetical protein